MKKIDIVYEDSRCLVVNKAAGLAVQGGKGIGASLDSILAEMRPQRPLLVHRLDRDTSGLILVAKTRQAAAEFASLFGAAGAKKGIVKRYTAVCKGMPPEPSGKIIMEIEIRGSKKNSETCYRCLPDLPGGEFAMLELELGTGRMHQIRRHLSMIGNPILGDDKYGDFSLNKALQKTVNLRRLLLHSSQLIIPLMPGGGSLDLRAPLPAYFLEFMRNYHTIS